MKRMTSGVVAALALTGLSSAAVAQSKTLDTIKGRGMLHCGVNTGLAGFSAPDDKGRWTGLDVDYCRAVAAAVLKDGEKVKFVPLTAKERFTALQSGEIDMLARNTTWTMSRDTALGLNFAGTSYYDGQGFMVKKALGVKSAKELKGASICVQTGTTTELNLADYFRANKMDYKTVTFEKNNEARGCLQLRPLRCLHHGRIRSLRRAAEAWERGRPYRAAGDHLQGAARAGRAPG